MSPGPRAGTSFIGLCPFHRERTPSFSIDLRRKRYHCFGCGADGDAVSFVMTTENLDFSGAVESLARRLGIELAPVTATDPARLCLPTSGWLTEFADHYNDERDRAAWLTHAGGPVTGIATGMRDLDERLGGLQRGNLVAIFGPRCGGKSRLAFRIAKHAAGMGRVLLASPQHSATDLVARDTVSEYPRLHQAGQEPYQHQYIRDALLAGACTAESLRLSILDLPLPSLDQLVEATWELAVSGELALLVVDEIDLVRSNAPDAVGEDATSGVASQLKALARETFRPILVTALFRPTADTPSRDPSMSDLRAQNAVTVHADVVLSLVGPVADHPRSAPAARILKNRNGAIGTVALS